MAVSISGTTLTFNDATTQTTARTSSNTVTSVAAGSGISVSGSTGAVTISATGGGTVTSVATGNGLSGGTITSTGTLVIACPSFNSVGSYVLGYISNGSTTTITAGSNYSAGGGSLQFISCSIPLGATPATQNNLSGTWKVMGATFTMTNFGCGAAGYTLICRVS